MMAQIQPEHLKNRGSGPEYSYGTFEIPMPEEERDRPSRPNYYKYWVTVHSCLLQNCS